MTRKLTKEYYANKREQNRIHEAILQAIPENAYYHNLIITLADLLQWCVIQEYKEDVFTKPPKSEENK